MYWKDMVRAKCVLIHITMKFCYNIYSAGVVYAEYQNILTWSLSMSYEECYALRVKQSILIIVQ